MSYYNNVFIIISDGDMLPDGSYAISGCRLAGQMLPAGSIPLAVINLNTMTYLEILNEYTPEYVMEWFINFADIRFNIGEVDIVKS